MKRRSNKQQALTGLTLALAVLTHLSPCETASMPCNQRVYKTGIVCVCNETYCDTLEVKTPESASEILVYSTSENGLRFKESKAQFVTRLNITDDHQTSFSSNLSQRIGEYFFPKNKIHINRTQTYQKIVGFGNALTGSVSHNLKLVPKLQSYIFNSYFSTQTGIGLNIIRTSIGGCDFDLEPWAYNELPENDVSLSNFTKLDPRDEEKVAFIKNLMQTSNNFDIKLLGSAWSPPKWMKSNNEWTGFSSLKDEYYQTWADYHLKYLDLMHQSGLDFWAITTGNEPLNGVTAFLFIKFMSLGWIPKTQGKWVADYLGPSMRESKFASNVKIISGDDQRFTFSWWFDNMYEAHPKSKDYIDGHGVHWYWDKYVNANKLSQVHEKYPDKMIIATEACSGDKPWEEHKPMIGYWSRGEDYVLDIIEDLNNYVNAWIDWNMILDEEGGPNYANNFVDTAVVINATTGEEFYKQPIFYAIGHFSRFILPGSVRLGSSSISRAIASTTFLRPDGLTVIVLYNKANHMVDVDIDDPTRSGDIMLTIPPKSIHTLLFK